MGVNIVSVFDKEKLINLANTLTDEELKEMYFDEVSKSAHLLINDVFSHIGDYDYIPLLQQIAKREQEKVNFIGQLLTLRGINLWNVDEKVG